jgi:uncharacterized protein YegP (UPF0339 family)
LEEQFEIYEDDRGEWRWRKVAPNGGIVDESARSYTQRSGARAAAKRNDATLPISMVREGPEGEGDFHAGLAKERGRK